MSPELIERRELRGREIEQAYVKSERVIERITELSETIGKEITGT
jgi:hypothetical protein